MSNKYLDYLQEEEDKKKGVIKTTSDGSTPTTNKYLKYLEDNPPAPEKPAEPIKVEPTLGDKVKTTVSNAFNAIKNVFQNPNTAETSNPTPATTNKPDVNQPLLKALETKTKEFNAESAKSNPDQVKLGTLSNDLNEINRAIDLPSDGSDFDQEKSKVAKKYNPSFSDKVRSEGIFGAIADALIPAGRRQSDEVVKQNLETFKYYQTYGSGENKIAEMSVEFAKDSALNFAATGAAERGIINKDALDPYSLKLLESKGYLDDKGDIKKGKTAVESVRRALDIAVFFPEAFLPAKAISETVAGEKVISVLGKSVPLSEVLTGTIIGSSYATIYTPNLENVFSDSEVAGDAVKRFFEGATFGTIVSFSTALIRAPKTPVFKTMSPAEQEELKSMYMSLAKKYHPDAPTGNTEAFKAVKAKYDAADIKWLRDLEKATPQEAEKLLNIKLNTSTPSGKVIPEKISSIAPEKAPTKSVNDIELQAGWKGGDAQKARFDLALLNKDSKTITQMLPEVPQYYKEKFAEKITGIVPNAQIVPTNKPIVSDGSTGGQVIKNAPIGQPTEMQISPTGSTPTKQTFSPPTPDEKVALLKPDTEIYHGAPVAISQIAKEGFKFHNIPTIGEVMQLTDSKDIALKNYGMGQTDNLLNTKVGDFKWKIFDSPKDEQAFVQEMGTKDLASAINKEGKYDGFIVHQDYGDGHVYALSNKEVIAKLISNFTGTKNTTDSLIQEAKKYKSAEEFVDRNIMDVARNSDADVLKRNGLTPKSTKQEFNIAIRKLQDRLTNKYGTSLPTEGNTRRLDAGDQDLPFLQEIRDKVVENKYIPFTRSQLTDIWNQANKDSAMPKESTKRPSTKTARLELQKKQMKAIEKEVRASYDVFDNPKIEQYSGVINKAIRTYNLTKAKGREDIATISKKISGFDEALQALRDVGVEINTMQELINVKGGKGQYANAFASKGSSSIGNFEDVNKPSSKPVKENFKLFEKAKELTDKYIARIEKDLGVKKGSIGEKYTSKGALGTFYPDTYNVRVNGLNNLSVVAHEDAHLLDFAYNITKELQNKGLSGLRITRDLTNLYVEYYPQAKKTHKLSVRVIEGFATLLQKYVEMPTTIEAKYPQLVKSFLKEGGSLYQPVVGDMINDLRSIISEYQGLDPLDKIGARVVNNTLKTETKPFLTPFDKLRTFIEDDIYPIEKIGKVAGTAWTKNDPSLWIRQLSRGNGVTANNILNAHTGYWTMNANGDFYKRFESNWKNLSELLNKEKTVDSFGNYLVARDQYYEWQELDKLKTTLDETKLKLETQEATPDDVMEAQEAFDKQATYLKNNGFTRDEVTQAFEQNEQRFVKESALYDKLVRADLELLHNPNVQLVNDETFAELSSNKGYASMKRAFFDELLGDSETYVGAGKGSSKASSLKSRTGGEQQIINPLLNGMTNHIEIMKKAMRQVVYNKLGDIADKGLLPNLFQKIALKPVPDASGRITFPQERDENIIMVRKDFKRVPIVVNKEIKAVVDGILTHQSMNIFEHLLVTVGRTFTLGTTGLYAPFSIVNFSADQWNAVVNTRNKYTPLLDQVKILGGALTKRGSLELRELWQEWEVMGGDRMTLFQAQMMSTNDAVKYITNEKKGLEKVIKLVDKGVDVLSIPSKYSETASRFSEYVKARKSGKSQVVALEEAGRITAPFHHIGAWKFGDKASMKYLVRSIPFANASLQVVAQTFRTAGDSPEGRNRVAFTMLAALAAYLASVGMVAKYGSDDQKEQYKDLTPQELGSFLYFPSIGGYNLTRIRISQELSTIGTVVAMIISDNVLGTKYSVRDYKDALTNWVPKQFDITSPIEMFMSWFNPAIKIPLELVANFRDYPKIRPLEGQSMQATEPRYRFNEATSPVAKALGDKFNISPIKIDFLLEGFLGRSVGYLTLKPSVYKPQTTVNREYLITLGRRVTNYYDDKEKIDQQYKALKDKYKDTETSKIPSGVLEKARELKAKQNKYNAFADALKEYKKIDTKDVEKLREARTKLIEYLNELP